MVSDRPPTDLDVPDRPFVSMDEAWKRTLIEFRIHYNSIFVSGAARGRAKMGWEFILRRLNILHLYSVDRAKKFWEHVVKMYKALAHPSTGSGSMGPADGAGTTSGKSTKYTAETWPFYELLHGFFAPQHSMHPPLLISSHGPVVVSNRDNVGSTQGTPHSSSTSVKGPGNTSNEPGAAAPCITPASNGAASTGQNKSASGANGKTSTGSYGKASSEQNAADDGAIAGNSGTGRKNASKKKTKRKLLSSSDSASDTDPEDQPRKQCKISGSPKSSSTLDSSTDESHQSAKKTNLKKKKGKMLIPDLLMSFHERERKERKLDRKFQKKQGKETKQFLSIISQLINYQCKSNKKKHQEKSSDDSSTDEGMENAK